jgi:hypothetical protein
VLAAEVPNVMHLHEQSAIETCGNSRSYHLYIHALYVKLSVGFCLQAMQQVLQIDCAASEVQINRAGTLASVE